MDKCEAQRVIESLRNGIPPNGYVRNFTVGQNKEIEYLTSRLKSDDPGVLMLKANYGSGKTHLLRYMREQAFVNNYAVSIVTLDSYSDVRFNRMDQVFGATCRNIAIPQAPGSEGIRPFFDLISEHIKKNEVDSFWQELSNNNKWNNSDKLDSQSLYVSLRAWITGEDEVMDVVEDFLYQPWNYRTLRKKLYEQLVGNLHKYFHDPRSDKQFYYDEVFVLHTQAYYQSWAALRDLNTLARAIGLRGLTILFDEFEDVFTNLRNVAYQEAALRNLLLFNSNKQFPGKTFYAVTPDFLDNYLKLIINKRQTTYYESMYDYYNDISLLPSCELSPLKSTDMEKLAMKIRETHGAAYDWEPNKRLNDSDIKHIVNKAASVKIQDRVRNVIVTVVKALDHQLLES